MSCIVIASVLYMYCFFPLFSPVDPETDGAAGYDYTADDQSLPQSSKASNPPLSIPILPISFPLILALDFATVLASSYSDA